MHAGLVDVRALLGALRGLGVRSLMVEGGARVIRSFLHAARGEGGSVAAGEGENAGRNKDKAASASASGNENNGIERIWIPFARMRHLARLGSSPRRLLAVVAVRRRASD